MRIISGKHKGRHFHPPRNNPARPTTDIAKEGLFNILNNNLDLEDLKFLDLFGGTGRLGQLPDLIFENQLLTLGGWFVLEHSPEHNFDADPRCRARRNYGQTNFSIFINGEPETDE